MSRMGGCLELLTLGHHYIIPMPGLAAGMAGCVFLNVRYYGFGGQESGSYAGCVLQMRFW